MTNQGRGIREPVYFCYANPAGFSGQKAATELVMQGLSKRGWSCRALLQPVYDRTDGTRLPLLRYLSSLFYSWGRACLLLRPGKAWLCVNLGQTRSGFIRDAVPLLLGRVGLGRARVIVSLHGSLFMRWPDRSAEFRVFQFLLKQTGTVTVLGERQKARLLALGVAEGHIAIVANSCEWAPVPAAELEEKHSADAGRPVRCLHLSSLIDTKGFPEYLEALDRLSAMPGPRVEAVLCGRPVESEFSNRFNDAASMEAWIEIEMEKINGGKRVKVEWIRGAAGAAKEALFREADIFVLPTRYAVEAQPLVLLEAMASGCAIVTTSVGEIPSILDKESAVFLENGSSGELAKEMQVLVSDPSARLRLARAAHHRFVQDFQKDRHIDSWENLLDSSRSGAEAKS